MAKTRLSKVNALIKQELGTLITANVDMPNGILATITRVDSSVDLKHATVYFSVLPAHKAPSTLRRLRTKLNMLQRLLNKKLSMKPVPRLRFIPDEGERHAARIEELLAKDRVSKPIEKEDQQP